MATRTFPQRRSTQLYGTQQLATAPPPAQRTLIPWVFSPLTVYGDAPEIRQEETDQTDPTGRFRTVGVGGQWGFEEKNSAGVWPAAGAAYLIFQYDNRDDAVSRRLNIFSPNFAGGAVFLLAGNGGAGKVAEISLTGSSTVPSISIATGDGTNRKERITVNGGSNPDIDIRDARLDLDSGYSQQTVGPAGAASAVPASPDGYIQIKIGNVLKVIPYFDDA